MFTPLADAVFAACSFAYYYDTINENARIIAEQNQAIAAGNAAIAEQNAALAASAQKAQVSGSLASSLGLSQSFASAGTEYFYNDGVFYVKDADGMWSGTLKSGFMSPAYVNLALGMDWNPAP